MKRLVALWLFSQIILTETMVTLSDSVMAVAEPTVALTQLGYSGSGCPEGSASALLSPDGEALTLLFDRYVASSNESRVCALDLDLSYSPGWSFALYRADLRGFANVSAGASAIQEVGFRIGSGPYRVFATQRISDPFESDYFFRYLIGGDEARYSACPSAAQRIRLRTSLRTVGNATMTVDSIDGVVEEEYRFAWKRCGAPSPDADTIPLYRAYNPNADSHFYTTSSAEYSTVVAAGYRAEGVAVLVSRVNNHPELRPIHRLYNPNNGRHYYTINTAEKNALVNLGWRYEKDEGFLFGSAVVGTEMVSRLYNRKTGGHLFSANPTEVEFLLHYSGTPWELHSPLGYGLVEID